MNKALVDYLEELMDLARPVRLKFRGDNGGTITMQAKITAVEGNEPEPVLFADGAIRIPLDRLIQVNERLIEGAA